MNRPCWNCGDTGFVLDMPCNIPGCRGAEKLSRERKESVSLLSEAADVLEFCEGALVDHFASEDGLDPEAARRVAWVVSEMLTKLGRTSILLEAPKQPSS